MEIVFKNSKMKKDCEDCKRLSRQYGDQQSEEIIKRINELNSADNLYDISKIPQARLHPLIGKLKGCFAVDIKHPYRLILYPLNGDPCDLKTITSVKIINITDYH